MEEQKSSFEWDSIKNFAKFLNISEEEIVDNNKEEGQCDFLLPSYEIAVEVSDIRDREWEDIWSSKGFGRSRKNLREALQRYLDKNYNNTVESGIYFIKIDPFLKVRNYKEADKLALKIFRRLEALNCSCYETTFNYHKRKIAIERIPTTYSDKLDFEITTFFSREIDILSTSLNYILKGDVGKRPKIPRANNQLANAPIRYKKVLIFKNEYKNPVSKNVLVKLSSELQSCLSEYKNIDEIWIQIRNNGKLEHFLLCSRNNIETKLSVLGIRYS